MSTTSADAEDAHSEGAYVRDPGAQPDGLTIATEPPGGRPNSIYSRLSESRPPTSRCWRSDR